ncbi:hypothetical protein GCM10009624_32000 [Gordonia sinesedis]
MSGTDDGDRTEIRQHPRDAEPYAPSATGHQDDPVVEPEVGPPRFDPARFHRVGYRPVRFLGFDRPRFGSL